MTLTKHLSHYWINIFLQLIKDAKTVMVVKSWYNGYSPKERDDKFKVMKKMLAQSMPRTAVR